MRAGGERDGGTSMDLGGVGARGRAERVWGTSSGRHAETTSVWGGCGAIEGVTRPRGNARSDGHEVAAIHFIVFQ